MLPIVDSNLRPEALIEQVLPAYRLGAIRRCRLHTRGINDTFQIETADEVFFLRVYRHGCAARKLIPSSRCCNI
jgi:Ser/Thr protein kinase RdoA (MazF antagonist)